jgi:hypothetical protein
MQNLRKHFIEVNQILLPLQSAFNSNPEGGRRREYFLESVEANEFEIALHALCDFLLEHQDASVTEDLLARIDELHKKMEIDDECVIKLKSRHRI